MSDSNYLSPGVYIQELEGPAPIIGVSTSIAAFIGMAERGPVNFPIAISGSGDYTRWFGGLLVPDEFADPVDPKRFHCYLPYAVAGFFNNQGQTAYVIRVLPEEASAAWEYLSDRTGTSPNVSALIRGAAIGDGLGTAASPSLVMLSQVPSSGTIRIDNGSVSEYVTIAPPPPANPVTATDAVALDLPLTFSHAVGAPVAPYARATQGTPPYTLSQDFGQGLSSIIVNSADPLNTFQDLLIELVGSGIVAVFAPLSVTALGGGQYSITLNQPLPVTFFTASTVVTALVAKPQAAYTPIGAGGYTLFADAIAPTTQLSVQSVPADNLTTFNNWLIALTAGTTTVILPVTGAVAAGAPGSNEYTVTLGTPLTQTFTMAGGTKLQAYSAVPASGIERTASGGDQLLFVTGGGGFALGELVDIDGATPVMREIRTVGALTQLTFATPSTVDWPSGSIAVPVTVASGAALSLTAPAGTPPTNAPASSPASTGGQVLALASRAGLSEGSVLLIGTAPAQEYAVVAALQGPQAVVGPNPGTVALETPLAGYYPLPVSAVPITVTPVAASVTPSPGTRSTQFVLDAPATVGSNTPTTAIVTWAGGDWTSVPVAQIKLPDGTLIYNQLAAAPTAQALDEVALTTPVLRNHPIGSPVVSRSPLIQVQALDAGAWGSRIALAVQDELPGLVSSIPVQSFTGTTQLTLSSLSGIQPGSYLELLTQAGTVVDPSTPLKVTAINVSQLTITLDAPGISLLQSAAIGASTPTTRPVLRSREFRISVYLYRHPDPAVPARNTQVIQTEVFRNLSMDPRHSNYFQTVIGEINGPPRLSDGRPEGTSWLIRVLDVVTTLGLTPAQLQAAQWGPRLGPEPLIDVLPNGLQRPAQHKLDLGGDDSLATVDDDTYIGADATDPLSRTGIYALQNIPQFSILAVPGQATPEIQTAMIDYCETSQYVFAVLDPQYWDSAIADIQAQRQNFDTKYAAIYYPWLTIPDPMPANLALVPDFYLPPSGHVVGVMARVDDSRGVFKAPANEVIAGITGLSRTLAQGDQDLLNPNPTNINVIRDFRPQGRGLRIWGARVITSDDNYMYVPVRRLLIFIEQSLNIGLQDVVFEPNGPPLWASVERVITNFLTTVWASGALQGATPAQSFFVRCDLTTMTQLDIDAGRLIALVGVAPVKPAEFVIIQIALMTAATS